MNTKKKYFMDSMLKDWQEIFNRENERAQDSLRIIWKDIDFEYQRSFNLPALTDSSQTNLSLSSPNDNKSFSEEAYNFAGEMFRQTMKEDNIRQ